MLVYRAPSMVNLSVQIETSVTIFRPHLANERIGKSEVYAPVTRPCYRNPGVVKLLTPGQLFRYFGQHVHLCELFVDNTFCCDPVTKTQTLVANPSKTVQLGQVRATTLCHLSVHEQEGIVLVRALEHHGKTVITALLQPVRWMTRVAVAK